MRVHPLHVVRHPLPSVSFPRYTALGARRPGGRCPDSSGERNVRAPPGRVPGNTRAARADGECHRNTPPRTGVAARRCTPPCDVGRFGVRVKWCGKSAPPPSVMGTAGKPHPEQGQIGGRPPRRKGRPVPSSGRPLESRGDAGPRWMAAVRLRRIQNSAYRPPGSLTLGGTRAVALRSLTCRRIVGEAFRPPAAQSRSLTSRPRAAAPP